MEIPISLSLGPADFFGPAEKKRKTIVVTAKRDYSRDELVNPNKILNLDLKSKTTASQKQDYYSRKTGTRHNAGRARQMHPLRSHCHRD
jgi:hypothetical protein